MLRLTDTEYEVLSEYAKDARLPLAEYTRLQALNKTVKIKYEIVADVPEIKKLLSEFGKIGNNLNQIARRLNQGEPQTLELEKSLRRYMADLYEMKDEVMKMAGDFLNIAKK